MRQISYKGLIVVLLTAQVILMWLLLVELTGLADVGGKSVWNVVIDLTLFVGTLLPVVFVSVFTYRFVKHGYEDKD